MTLNEVVEYIISIPKIQINDWDFLTNVVKITSIIANSYDLVSRGDPYGQTRDADWES